MNCPVCKKKIEFKIPEEDIYYDCSHCQSSLLFSKGECQVINAEQIESSNLEKATENSSMDDIDQSINQKSENEFVEQSIEGNLLSTDVSEKTKTQVIESFQADSSHKTASQKQANKELEPIEKAEDFYPNEKTEVPELQPKLEELEQSVTDELDEPNESSYKFEESSNESDSTSLQDENIKPSPKETEDFSDVAEFAKNQEENTKGIYLYDLTLSEINSQSLKEEVIAVLEDSYLNLLQDKDSLNLKDVIEKGEIKIPRISPIQTYIIVNSLMGLPLNIHWEQHHIADG